MLQCVAVWFGVDVMCCCSELQCVVGCCSVVRGRSHVLLQCDAVCCRVLQCGLR